MVTTTAKDPYIYILVGGMGAILLGHWFPSLKNLNSMENGSHDRLSIEQIQGIDLRALSICRQKGLL